MKIAVYPGTFDPITNGHADLVARATRLFDRVVVAVAKDTGKAPVCGIEERVQLANVALADIPAVEVVPFEGLVEFCRNYGQASCCAGCARFPTSSSSSSWRV